MVSKKILRCFCRTNRQPSTDMNCNYGETCETSGEDANCYAFRRLFRNGDFEDEAGCSKGIGCYFKWPSNSYYCCDTDYCNEHPPNVTDFRQLAATTESLMPTSAWFAAHPILITIGVIALILGAIIFIKCRVFGKSRRRIAQQSIAAEPLVKKDLENDEKDEVKNLQERQMVMDITLGGTIGRGFFGKVYMATYHRDQVAVKAFENTLPNYTMFMKEKNVYKAFMISKNENILAYVGDGMRNNPFTNVPELWLVTEYCQGGSLQSYLDSRPVENEQMCIQMCYEICSGLAYLHREIRMVGDVKPEIAHRDLKPHNILLRKNGDHLTCVIGDFGYAVTKKVDFARNFDSEIDGDSGSDTENTQRLLVGTGRYMAPEVLNGTLNLANFKSLKDSDIYSLGLVLWQIGTRTIIEGQEWGPCLPYSQIEFPNQNLPLMCELVCKRQERPPRPDYWLASMNMMTLYHILSECWHPDPSRRVTATYAQGKFDEMRHSFITGRDFTAKNA